MMTSTASDIAPVTPPAPKLARLGEELPVFCEQCGYSLHGLPPIRCAHCEILHFRCPECGHHQPINTLRPAAQRILGRVRATCLALWVFFKLNFFGWLLFAWVMMGYVWFEEYSRPFVPALAPAIDDMEMLSGALLAFMFFAVPFATVGRMLLLRWRRDLWVGLILALCVAVMILLGAWWRVTEFHDPANRYWPNQEYAAELRSYTFFTPGLLLVEICAFGCTFLGAIIVWPVWATCARLFLPTHAATALLDWQRGQSDSAASRLT